MELIKFITSKEFMKYYLEKRNFFSPRKDLTLYEGDPLMEKVSSFIPYGREICVFPKSLRAFMEVFDVIDDWILVDKMSIDDALTKANAEVTKIMQDP
jgi:hypothetical protein